MSYYKTIAIEPLGIIVDKHENINPFAEEAIMSLLKDNYNIIIWNDHINLKLSIDNPNILQCKKNKDWIDKCFFCIDTNKEFVKKFRIYSILTPFSVNDTILSKSVLTVINKYKKYVTFISNNAT